jgi:xanthine dehydrogenase small subunit
MDNSISFVLNGKIQQIDFNHENKPTDTVLNFLRKNPCSKGVKEGCAEGDCGACTVVLGELSANNKIKYKAIDSCLVFLPMLQGKQLITVENLSKTEKGVEILHPVQEAMVEENGSQCGFCTPGIVMSMFAMYKNFDNPSRDDIDDCLTGNLCRCTGYKPIIEASAKSCSKNGVDDFTSKEKEIVSLLTQIKASQKDQLLSNEKQKYYQPLEKAAALKLRAEFPNSTIINGATDVALRVTKRHELLTSILDLSQVEELKKCHISNYIVKFGAGMSLEDVKIVSKLELPALHDLLAVFGSKQIRELGTIGGNIGSSSPISDVLPLLMVYNAEIKLQNVNSDRIVNMNNYVIDYRVTARKEDELITTVIVPKPSKSAQVKFYKISKRKDLDISTLSAAFLLELEGSVVTDIRIAYGGMAAVARRVPKLESLLLGKTWSRELINEGMALLENEFTPLSDARSGAEFRTVAAKNLLLKFWSETAI